MKLPIIAVTVSKNCIERDKWSVKYLTIGKRTNGLPFFHVRHVGETGFDKVKLQGIAIRYAFSNGILFLVNVRSGTFITTEQKEKLREYGVAV